MSGFLTAVKPVTCYVTGDVVCSGGNHQRECPGFAEGGLLLPLLPVSAGKTDKPHTRVCCTWLHGKSVP